MQVFAHLSRYIAPLLCALCCCAHAQDTPPNIDSVVVDPDVAAETSAAAQDTPPKPEPAAEPPPRVNPCSDAAEGLPWLDLVHLRIYQLTCVSAWWFDGLFGSRRYYQEYRETSGMITAGGNWDQLNGFDQVLRFRLRVNLPETKGRLNAFIGRGDERELIAEATPDTYALPAQFARRDEDQVFVGLGFRDNLQRRGSFDADVGVRVTFPLDSYVKGSYRFTRPLGESNLLRLRETVFWQKSQGFGTTAVAQLDHLFGERHLLRWSSSGTFSERTVGMHWYSELTLYHFLSERRAIAYQAVIDGSTDLPVPLSQYGAGIIYRQKVFRDWMIMEVRGGMSWPKYLPFEDRHSNLNGGLAFEMRFGRR